MEEATFPCPLEQTVASALLLLSTTPPSSFSSCDKNTRDDDLESLLIASAKSYDSITSSSVTTSDEACSDLQRLLQKSTPAATSNEMKLKVVRRSRSKNFRISDCQKLSLGKLATVSWGSETKSEVSSCLSTTTSSSVSSARSRKPTTRNKAVGSPHLQRRAESIIGLLTHCGGISEVRIRAFLGDSPDTSKALRMLVRQAAVKRSGAGGRSDPYIYMIA